MRPESTSAVLRPDLTAQLNEYDSQGMLGMFIGKKAAPLFRSAVASATYPIYNRENFKKRNETKRSNRGAYNRIIGQFGTGTYDCDDNGLEYPVDDRLKRRYAKYFDAETAAAKIAYYQVMLNHEYRVHSLFANGGWTNHNVAVAWSTAATGVPITDINTGVLALTKKCGVPRNRISLIIPEDDVVEMMGTTQVTNKVQYTYQGIIPGQLSASEIAQVLRIGQVLIASSSYDSTEEGYTESDASIWTAGVMWLAVLAGENEPLETPSAARTILWTEDSPEDPVVETYRDDTTRGDVVRCRHSTDEVALGETDLFVYQITNT